MKALEWITKEAKKLRKEYPKRFATWKEYVAQASAIYASKHKGKSPVGKKKIGATKSSSTHTDTKSHNINIKMGNYPSFGAEDAAKNGKSALNRLKSAAQKHTKYQKKYFDAVAISNDQGYVVLTLAKNVKAVYVLSFTSIIHRGKETYSKPQFHLYRSSGTVLKNDEDKNPKYKLISKFNK